MVDSFLQYLQYEKRYSSCTVLSYRQDLEAFVDFLNQNDTQIPLNQATTLDVRRWLMYLHDQKRAATTINRRISCLRTFYKYLLIKGQIEQDPTQKIRAIKKPKTLPAFFSEKEMNRALLVSDDITNFEAVRNGTIIELFYQTGIRSAELLNIKDLDIDFERRSIRVFGKRSKERMVPFGENLELILRNYIEIRNREVPRVSNFLFTLENGNQMYARGIYRIVHDTMNMVSTQRLCSPHILRHTFASSMLNHGADLNAVKELLGHANLAATQLYTHTTFEQMQKVYEQAHPRAK